MGNIWVPPPILSTWKLGGGGLTFAPPPSPISSLWCMIYAVIRGGGALFWGPLLVMGGEGQCSNLPLPPFPPLVVIFVWGGGALSDGRGVIFGGGGGMWPPPPSVPLQTLVVGGSFKLLSPPGGPQCWDPPQGHAITQQHC